MIKARVHEIPVEDDRRMWQVSLKMEMKGRNIAKKSFINRMCQVSYQF